jgi:hypothetical protein
MTVNVLLDSPFASVSRVSRGHPSLGSVIAKQENPLKKEMRTGKGEEGREEGGRRISHFFSISALHLSLPIPPPK